MQQERTLAVHDQTVVIHLLARTKEITFPNYFYRLSYERIQHLIYG